MRIACCAEQTTPTSSTVARVEGVDRSPEPGDAIVFDPISAPLMLVSLSLNKRTVTYTGRANHSNDFGRYNLVLEVRRCSAFFAAVAPVQINTELYFALYFLLCIIQRPRQIPDFSIKAISLLCRDEDGANESRSWNIGCRIRIIFTFHDDRTLVRLPKRRSRIRGRFSHSAHVWAILFFGRYDRLRFQF
jgi:hypothetical protein